MLVAAVLSALVPEDAVSDLLGGSSGVWAFALAAAVGIPLYVCEGEEVPLTVGLLAAGLGPGPSLTFLLGSVGTCVPTLLMARGILGERATVLPRLLDRLRNQRRSHLSSVDGMRRAARSAATALRENEWS
jgi:uncharacterized membrane protein YraQ (UPF0718 family)